jgi:hypothetical protein
MELKASRVKAEPDYTMPDIVKSTAISGILELLESG